MNPAFENITALCSAAANEGDCTRNVRLRHVSYFPGPAAWLSVKWLSQGLYEYRFEQGRKSQQLTRDEAQTILDREWGKLP